MIATLFGFAAFSNTLTIKSSAEVTPSQSQFDVNLSGASASETTTVTPTLSPASDGPSGTNATIDNSGTNSAEIQNLHATFTKPGQTVTFGTATGAASTETKVCTAGSGTTASTVESACEGISLTLSVGSLTNLTASQTNIASHSLAVGGNEEITVTIDEIQKGDIIVTSHHIPCGECIYCKHGNVSMCEHFKSTNIRPGGFAEYVYLSEEHLQNVAHLKPENLTNIEASFYEPLGCIVRAVKRADLKDFDTALVVGLGSIGILSAQAIKAFGAKVVGCDLIEERVNILKSLGIDAFDVRKLPEDFKADCIFMTSGADKAIDTALKYIRNGGKILVFSSTPHDETAYPNNEIYYRELTVLGSYSPAPEELKNSLELL